MTAMMSISGVHTFYGHIEALKGIDIEIGEGEIVTIIGANGAGKSTLLMTICGTPKARHGSIVFEGEDITQKPTFEIMRKGIAQSPEGRRIFPRMSVLENLKMGAITSDPKLFDEDLDKVFAIFPRLKERQAQRGGTLSGGEQQMLAIARALMSRPKLLLCDEPSLGLAPIITKELFEVIGRLNRDQGLSVLLVEQNANLAVEIAHRVYLLETGRIVASGTAEQISSDDSIRKAYLGY